MGLLVDGYTRLAGPLNFTLAAQSEGCASA